LAFTESRSVITRAALEAIRAKLLTRGDHAETVHEIADIVECAYGALLELDELRTLTSSPRDDDPTYAPDGLRWNDRRR
jgi:hypothetical protein